MPGSYWAIRDVNSDVNSDTASALPTDYILSPIFMISYNRFYFVNVLCASVFRPHMWTSALQLQSCELLCGTCRVNPGPFGQLCMSVLISFIMVYYELAALWLVKTRRFDKSCCIKRSFELCFLGKLSTVEFLIPSFPPDQKWLVTVRPAEPHLQLHLAKYIHKSYGTQEKKQLTLCMLSV